jgi:hypothetical protein
MGKKTPDAILDAMADAIIAACNGSPNGRLYVLTAEPADLAAINASPSPILASVKVDTSDFTKANGDASGRKVTVAQQSSLPIVKSGTATHIALASPSALLYVTTCTDQALTSGGTVTVPAWDIEVADPV